MRVTGGISRDEGALCEEEAAPLAWAMSPVRIIGVWRRVDMALPARQ